MFLAQSVHVTRVRTNEKELYCVSYGSIYLPVLVNLRVWLASFISPQEAALPYSPNKSCPLTRIYFAAVTANAVKTHRVEGPLLGPLAYSVCIHHSFFRFGY